jgi:transcriptional regulator with XRE-family HTH domain
LNETLCRALLEARLTEEDVAARLQVDPKTVRRWLEGRVPYLRYRWAIAAMLGTDETDLWPQLRTGRARPDEVLAVYPHRDTVPRDVWLRVLGSAQHEIGILEDTGMPLAGDLQVVTLLGELAQSGVSVRICLCDLEASALDLGTVQPETGDVLAASLRDGLVGYAPLRGKDQSEIRLYRGIVYSSIYYADDEFLISQHVHGIPAGQAPVLHLRRTDPSDMAATYLDAFERAWADAQPVG